MLVPVSKKLYIETRHELGREWEMFDASSINSNPTWEPLQTMEEASELVLYDSGERDSVECVITNMFFEDLFPDVAATVWGNEGPPAQGTENRYFTERQLYSTTTKATLKEMPIAIFLITPDSPEICLGIMSIGDKTQGQGNPRIAFTGLGGKGMPIFLAEGDRLVIRMNHWPPVEGSWAEAEMPEGEELGLFPAYGNVPMYASGGGGGVYNLQQWNFRFFMNCTMEAVETTMEERTADELGFK